MVNISEKDKLETSRTKLDNKKVKQYNITAPILKSKRTHQQQVELEMPEYNFDDFSKVSFDDQTKLFNAIKNTFIKLREKSVYMDEHDFEVLYYSNLLELFNLAVTGNVAAMDYLCYSYKKGIDGILPINLTLAHKWGMLAIANGSKLSVDRLRMFITPVFDYVEDSDVDVEHMMERYDIPDGDAAYFVAETFAGLYNPKMNISLLEMAREDPVSIESNFQKFLHDANETRDKTLPDILKYLK